MNLKGLRLSCGIRLKALAAANVHSLVTLIYSLLLVRMPLVTRVAGREASILTSGPRWLRWLLAPTQHHLPPSVHPEGRHRSSGSLRV